MTEDRYPTPAPVLVPCDHIGPSNNTRKNIVVVTLLLTWLVIGFLLKWGDPNNSLHTSAMAWAFTMNGAVIGAFIFGVAWDNMNFSKVPR